MRSQIGIGVMELFSLFLPLLFLVVLFFLIRWAVSSGVRSAAGDLRGVHEGEASAEEMLERRYAGGEISREDYLTIRDDITRKQNA